MTSNRSRRGGGTWAGPPAARIRSRLWSPPRSPLAFRAQPNASRPRCAPTRVSYRPEVPPRTPRRPPRVYPRRRSRSTSAESGPYACLRLRQRGGRPLLQPPAPGHRAGTRAGFRTARTRALRIPASVPSPPNNRSRTARRSSARIDPTDPRRRLSEPRFSSRRQARTPRAPRPSTA